MGQSVQEKRGVALCADVGVSCFVHLAVGNGTVRTLRTTFRVLVTSTAGETLRGC